MKEVKFWLRLAWVFLTSIACGWFFFAVCTDENTPPKLRMLFQICGAIIIGSAFAMVQMEKWQKSMKEEMK